MIPAARNPFAVFACLLILGGCGAASQGPRAAESPAGGTQPSPRHEPAAGVEPLPDIKVTGAGPGAAGHEWAAEILREKGRTVVLVTCQRGIGHIRLTLNSGQWPAGQILFRFQYAPGRPYPSLESFKLVDPGTRAVLMDLADRKATQGGEVGVAPGLLGKTQEVEVRWVDGWR